MKIHKPFFEKKLYPNEYAEKLTKLLINSSNSRRLGEVKGFFSKLWRSKDIDMEFYEALAEVLFNTENLSFDNLKNILEPFCSEYPHSLLDDIVKYLEGL